MYLKRRINDSVENLAKDSCMISRCLFCRLYIYIYVRTSGRKLKTKRDLDESWDELWSNFYSFILLEKDLQLFQTKLKDIENSISFCFTGKIISVIEELQVVSCLNIRSLSYSGKMLATVDWFAGKFSEEKFENSIYHTINNMASNIIAY